MIPSISKGKGKEETQWSSGWWAYHPLLDNSQRPVVWSSTSTIFSAHSTQPLVTARLFSSSKQFVLPSPTPVISSPSSYEPPTVISVSPGGDWLFAYFPSSEIDGVGCLWQRGSAIDVWALKEWWTLTRGRGIVTASWLGPPREWTVNDAGAPARLPPRGPQTPISNPTLVLVTENRWVTVYYLRYYSTTLKTMSCPLGEPGSATESYPNPPEFHRTGSSRICTRAAIGLAYDETAIMVATRSRAVPSRTKDNNNMDSMNLALPLNLEMSQPELDLPIEWEAWGEDSSIELCEIRLNFDGETMGISSIPVPPIFGSDSGLTDLVFFSPPPPPRPAPQKVIYLAASYLDFGDYTSTPKSLLSLHTLSRASEPNPTRGESPRTWACSQAATRVFTDGVLAFMSSPSGQSPKAFGLLVGILDTTFNCKKSRASEIPVGVTKVLKIPDLSDHDGWEAVPIMSPIDSAGRDLPLNAAVSPNNTMLLCTSLTSMGPSQMSLQTVTRPIKNTPDTRLAVGIACALLSGTSSTDLSHVLALPSMTLDEVSETHYQALIFAENGQAKGTLTWRALGLFLETYMMRAEKTESEVERETLEARWQTALDICSLASCNAAFESCKDGDAFDLEAVWQLVGISTWIVGFTEKLLKECVLASDLTGPGPQPKTEAGSSDVWETRLSSIMLHLAHPYALGNFHSAVANVVQFKTKIGSLNASEENSQMAKNVLVDLIDCSGVDFSALEPLLAELLVEASNFNVHETRRSLALCSPTSAMAPHIRTAITKIVTAPLVVDTPRLFIKPSELMDGAPPILDERKNREKDVVAKGFLSERAAQQQQQQVMTCLRCGGRSEVGGHTGGGGSSLRWRAWERMWARHCICGGAWVVEEGLKV